MSKSPHAYVSYHIQACSWMPRLPELPPRGLLRCPSDSISPWQGVPESHAGLCACACVRVPPLAQDLFVFLTGLFFHVQPTKPHVFPLISPARLGWSPRHARGLPAGSERRGGRLPTPLARPDQARRGGVTLPAPALPGPHPHSSSCLAFKAHGLC